MNTDECRHKINAGFKEVFFTSKHYCKKCGVRISLCDRDNLLETFAFILLYFLIVIIIPYDIIFTIN
ncbi:MAG: hypothetical protein A2Y15_09800 [Clostridiales bacterium GWF2_36_10]|nr:MAG: hypothetical protein A2Y15_09800 [Clostridiales bacterium GWF2_36_10]HAN20203.1 hypothetical protein [Clostridiales bacterium]